MIKRSGDFMEGKLSLKLIKVNYHLTKFGGHRHCGGEDLMILVLSRDLARPRDQRFKRLYRQKPIKVSYHPAKFGGHKHCGIGDIMILVCHVILQDHSIKGSCDFMGRCPSE